MRTGEGVQNILQFYNTVYAWIFWQVQIVFLLDVIRQEASRQVVLPCETGGTSLWCHKRDQDVWVDPIWGHLVNIPTFNKKGNYDHHLNSISIDGTTNLPSTSYVTWHNIMESVRISLELLLSTLIGISSYRLDTCQVAAFQNKLNGERVRYNGQIYVLHLAICFTISFYPGWSLQLSSVEDDLRLIWQRLSQLQMWPVNCGAHRRLLREGWLIKMSGME